MMVTLLERVMDLIHGGTSPKKESGFLFTGPIIREEIYSQFLTEDMFELPKIFLS